MTTFEINPARDIAPNADISYPASTVADIYRVARDIATDAGINGAIYVGGTNVIAGNTLIARVRITEPWYSVATDGWVTTDADYRTRPV
jgi:hypothetical protein